MVSRAGSQVEGVCLQGFLLQYPAYHTACGTPSRELSLVSEREKKRNDSFLKEGLVDKI